jgi:hypothetical protein
MNVETKNPQLRRIKKIMARKNHLMMKMMTKRKRVERKTHNLKITSKSISLVETSWLLYMLPIKKALPECSIIDTVI